MLISDRDIDRSLGAIEEVCDKMRAHDGIALTHYFIGGPDEKTATARA